MFKHLNKLRNAWMEYIKQTVVQNPVLLKQMNPTLRTKFLLRSYVKGSKQRPVETVSEEPTEEEPKPNNRDKYIQWGIKGVFAALIAKFSYDLYEKWYTEITWQEFVDILKN